MNSDCLFETERLLIRRFELEDAEDIYDYLSKEEVVKYEPYDILKPCEKEEEARYRKESDRFLAVVLKSSGKVIGNLYYVHVEPEHFLTWEFGYVFHSDYWHKGLATEATEGLLSYLFNKKNAHRVIAKCNPKNSASWRLLERLQMRKEAEFKEAAYFVKKEDGSPDWHDAYLYAILECDYYEKM
ncbi:MAG: GNAT family N-acetyltransferase [Clostridiales bacterium]|nr:GNAT family N-acetyltransferase [Clostridiales bacterium]